MEFITKWLGCHMIVKLVIILILLCIENLVGILLRLLLIRNISRRWWSCRLLVLFFLNSLNIIIVCCQILRQIFRDVFILFWLLGLSGIHLVILWINKGLVYFLFLLVLIWLKGDRIIILLCHFIGIGSLRSRQIHCLVDKRIDVCIISSVLLSYILSERMELPHFWTMS